ncbi:MAG: ABC transporter substrate-binding protein [Nitrospinota bacterium]
MSQRGVWGGWVALALALGLLAPAAAAEPLRQVSLAGNRTGSVGFITAVALEKGLDRRNGLRVEPKWYSVAQAEKALALGHVEVGYFAPLSAVKVQARGKRLLIFAPILWNHYHIVVPKDSPARSIADLRGKRLGSLSRASGGYTNLATLLRMQGKDIERHFRLVFGAPAALLAFLKKGDVDAILIFEPVATRLVASGEYRSLVATRKLWERETGGRTLLLVGLAAYEDWLKENAETARRVRQMYADAASYIRAHPEVFDEPAMKKILGVRTRAELEAIRASLPAVYATEWTAKTRADALFYLRKSAELGLLPADARVDVFVSP